MLVLLIVMTIVAIPRKESVPAELQTAALEAAAGVPGQVDAASSEIIDINIEEQSELKKQIDKFAKENPDAVAQLLRNWIADDWD